MSVLVVLGVGEWVLIATKPQGSCNNYILMIDKWITLSVCKGILFVGELPHCVIRASRDVMSHIWTCCPLYKAVYGSLTMDSVRASLWHKNLAMTL